MNDVAFVKAKVIMDNMHYVQFDRNQYASLLKGEPRISLEINGCHYTSLLDDEDTRKLHRLVTDAINRKVEHADDELKELQAQFDAL